MATMATRFNIADKKLRDQTVRKFQQERLKSLETRNVKTISEGRVVVRMMKFLYARIYPMSPLID